MKTMKERMILCRGLHVPHAWEGRRQSSSRSVCFCWGFPSLVMTLILHNTGAEETVSLVVGEARQNG